MEQEKYIDLHTHTTCSDGLRTPEQLIRDAKQAGLSAVAMTDHNTFAIDTPQICQGLELIPGCEFSTKYRTPMSGRYIDLHVVGLFFDGVPEIMGEVFHEFVPYAYPKAICRKLRELGIQITIEEVQADFPDAAHIGRSQIAKTLIRKGYASNTEDAFDRLIGDRSPHYVNPAQAAGYMETTRLVPRIVQNHGLPILAHPFHYHLDTEEIEDIVKEFRSLSDAPMGIEVYYRDYTQEQIWFLEAMSDKYNLLPSAGSDCHKLTDTFVWGGYALLEDMREAMK